MGAQNGDRPARAGIIDANVLLGSYGHQLAIGAEDHRFFARLPLPQDDDFLAGGGVPQPALAAGVERRNPAAVWAVRQREGRSFYPEQRQFSARRRVPEADGPVVGAGSNLLAVGAVGHRCHRSRVTAENGPALLGGHVVQVYVVVSKASHRDLPPRRAEHEPINSPAWHGPHVTGLVELAVDVLPLPVAVFLRRRLEGAADGGAVLQLQGGGRRGDVRSVALPTFRPLHAHRASSRAMTASWRCFASFSSACSARQKLHETSTNAVRKIPATPASDPATSGLRRHQRQPRSQTGTGRATIGSPPRNRRRSSASAVADSYRFPGSFCKHFSAIVSTSRGRPGTSRDGGTGSAFLT